MSEIVSTLFGAIFGAGCSFLFAWWQRAREARVSKTLELYERFHSPEYETSRVRVSDIVRQGEYTYDQIRDKTLFSHDDFVHTDRVIHFFELFCIYYSQGYLDDALVARTIAPYFSHYYETLLSPLIQRTTEAGSTDWIWMRTLRDTAPLIENLRSRNPGS